MKKKIVAAAVAMTMLSGLASAEQPKAEQYRQILQSGRFYLEYSVIDTDIPRGPLKNTEIEIGQKIIFDKTLQSDRAILVGKNIIHTLAGDGKNRLECVQKIEKKEKSSGILGGLIPIPFESSGNAANSGKAKKSAKRPEAMYKDGKYYRFLTPDVFDFSTNKTQVAKVLPEDYLFAETLDPTEGWQHIRNDLALPDELAVFSWNDVYRNPDTARTSKPAFLESRKVTVEKKEYDCDRYVADIQTVGGKAVAQEAYDMFYNKEGALSEIHRYFIRKGKETLIGKLVVHKISGDLPPDAFALSSEVKVYAAGLGDVNDFLGTEPLVETLGGVKK